MTAPLRVLHLGFEDPAMPGAGGGSLRTHEINRRLVADGMDVTVLTTRFPGCVDRVEDGVRYLHVGRGPSGSRMARLVGYVLGLPAAVRRYAAEHKPDLVVEDFFAPFSTMAAPLWTRYPTIGVVQWLQAKEKSKQYHLPLHLLQTFGVRSHRRLVSVSADTGEQLRTINPKLEVEVIGNGVDPSLFDQPQQAGRDVVYIGRLEFEGKGLDLLLDAWSRIHEKTEGDLVIAGEGHDEARVRREVKRLGLDDRVRFVGWVRGEEKARLLAEARVVAMPSRMETFGIVAVEGFAAATPVVAFAIPSLREVVPEGAGFAVEPFDVEAYAQRLLQVCTDAELALAMGSEGRKFAAGYDWDVLAGQQAEMYRTAAVEVMARTGRPGRRPPRPAVASEVGPTLGRTRS
jgi:glycosyltransferase involved in cell wall biosynthesis